MPLIHVTPLFRLRETLENSGAQHLLSLLSVGAEFSRPPNLAEANCLHLSMHDIPEERAGLVAPAAGHIEAILDFARAWDRTRPLVIHCYAGISRSTAAAFLVAAALQPGRSESELAWRLRALSPMATPNPRMVALADAALGREGRMSAAAEAIGRGAEAFEGVPFAWEIG